jgi:hypothetical protein
MADGNADFIAAVLSRLQKQQAAMESLFRAVESGIADLADPKRTSGIERMLSAQESALADLIEALKGSGTAGAIDRLAGAIRDMPAPTVNVPAANVVVNVPEQKPPTIKVEPNINVEAVMPAQAPPVIHNEINVPSQAGAKWKVTLPGQHGAPDRVMTIERTA